MGSAKGKKQEIAKARAERAAAKRQRRRIPSEQAPDTEAEVAVAPQAETLAELAALQERFERDDINFDEYEALKAALLERIVIE